MLEYCYVCEYILPVFSHAYNVFQVVLVRTRCQFIHVGYGHGVRMCSFMYVILHIAIMLQESGITSNVC